MSDKRVTLKQIKESIKEWAYDNQWLDAMGTNYYDTLDGKQRKSLAEKIYWDIVGSNEGGGR